MITIKEIIDLAKEHHLEGGKQTRLENNEILISIVGGVSGLYGDFINDFELAIIDKKTGDFMTKFFYPEGNDDVIGYMKGEDVEKIVNQILHKGFQVS